MQYSRLFLLLCVLLFYTECASAIGRRPVQHITVADGLPSNVVYDIYEDSKGFIWFCTDQGISRYDGAVFQNYSIKDGVPDREVFRIREDKQQRYWLVCYNRKACYLKYGKIYTSANDSLCRKIEAEDIAYDELFTDRNGNDCLVGKKIGILRPGPHLSILADVVLPGGRIMHFNRNGEDYIIANGGLYNINTGYYQKIPVYIGVSFYDGRSLFLSGFGRPERPQKLLQWQFRKDSLHWVKTHHVPSRIYQIGPSEAAGIKLATARGILVYDSLAGKILPDTAYPAGVPANNIRVDRQGNQWLSTLNDGVYFIPVNGGRLIDQSSGLVKNNILSVSLGRDGTIIAGDDDWHVYRIKNDNIIQTHTLTASQNNNRVLFTLDNGRGLLVAGTDAGLYAIDRTHTYPLLAPISIKAGVFSGRYFYAGSSLGLVIYDSHTQKARYEFSERITAMALDNKHTLWTGSINGLSYYKDGRAVQYGPDTLLTSCLITYITPAPGEGILAGSSTRGLFFVKDTRSAPVNLNMQRGLSGNSCKQLFVSEDSCIWLCSDGGIDRIWQTANGHFIIKPFPLPRGVTGNQINGLAENNGRLYLATARGILVLNSRDTVPAQPPRLYIEAINGNAFTGQSLRFPYKERNLQISYAGLNYTGGTPLQYKYVLAGGTDDTLYTYAQTIDLTALSPGEYNLLLWCSSPGGQWTTEPAQLSFIILPPIWRHPVTIVLFLLFAALVIILLFRLRINKVKKRAKQEALNQQQLAELEMNALRAQINPHFVFNALNAIQFYYSQNDEITANHYMTSFAHFIRLTLAHSKAHWLPLDEEIAMLRTYLELEQIRFQHSFTFTFDIEPGLTEHVAIPAMLIQPYVENAVNHGLRYLKERQGKLILSFTLEQDNLCCIVDDNGIGRAEAATYRQPQHTSLGMNITHQRIETINRMYGITISADIIDKQDTQDNPGGTRVSLLIPLKLISHDTDNTNR